MENSHRHEQFKKWCGRLRRKRHAWFRALCIDGRSERVTEP